MSSKFDKYLKNASPKDRAAIEKGKVFIDKEGVKPETPKTANPQNESYKESTGKDLDTNVAGYDEFNKPSNYQPIDNAVGEKAKSAAQPISKPNVLKEEGSKDNLAAYPSSKEKIHENPKSNDRMVGGMHQDEPEL